MNMVSKKTFQSLRALSLSAVLIATPAFAADVASTLTALRISNTVTGGLMPSSDPVFTQMVSRVQAGDVKGAASLAAHSSYFANYLARRLALQMQTPNLDASIGTDDDATAFLIAHFVGAAGVPPSLSTMWSENATYLVNVNGTQMHAAGLSAAQLAAVDWSSAVVRTPGQTTITVDNQNNINGSIAIPLKHVGGYTTLSDRASDNSFAEYGANAGTNLRMIEGIWEISTGLSLVDVQSTAAPAQNTPRFIPEYDPNFFVGQGQAACISCHAGGMSSVDHGYSAVADIYNFNSSTGFTYIAAPTTNTMKSLGSEKTLRATNAACNLSQTPTAVCNPDSVGVDKNQAWDLSTWASSGTLARMAWNGPTSGQGLNELGISIGQAGLVYERMTARVINEICPMGIFSQAQVQAIAASANPFAIPAGSDDIRTIVASIASDSSCQ